MIRQLALGSVLATFISTSALAEADDPLERLEQEVLQPTVRVEADVGPGTGTIIYIGRSQERCGRAPAETKRLCESGALVLTNYHVIAKHIADKAKASKSKVKPTNDQKPGTPPGIDVTVFEYTGPFSSQIRAAPRGAHIVASDPPRDLALIHVPVMGTGTARAALLARAGAEPRRGERAWRASCSAGFEPIVTEGRFWSVDIDKAPHEARLIATPALTEGSSGGGMYRRTGDGRFEMIAVSAKGGEMTTRSQEIEHISLSIPIGAVHQFLATKGFSFVVDSH